MEGITVLKEYGKDMLLLSSGFVLDRVLKAAKDLEVEGIHVTVADINILYGKNPQKILEVISGFEQIVTVEDHNVNGGMGAYISKLVCENEPKKVTRIGLTSFGESGPAKELADYYGFSPENISNVVRGSLK